MPSEPLVDEKWYQMLTEGDTNIRRARRFLSLLPSSPRCKICNSPFKGVGGTPRIIRSATGTHMDDVAGVRYLDYIGSWGVMLLGHCHPQVTEVFAKQSQKARGFHETAKAKGIDCLRCHAGIARRHSSRPYHRHGPTCGRGSEAWARSRLNVDD